MLAATTRQRSNKLFAQHTISTYYLIKLLVTNAPYTHGYAQKEDDKKRDDDPDHERARTKKQAANDLRCEWISTVWLRPVAAASAMCAGALQHVWLGPYRRMPLREKVCGRVR